MHTVGTQSSASPIVALKRRLFQILLPLAVLVFSIDWVMTASHGDILPFDAVAYPTLITLYSCVTVLLFLRTKYARALEIVSFVAFMIYMAVDISIVLSTWQQSNDAYRLATTPLWIPLVYVTAFFFFETRQALIISLLFFVLLLIPGGIYLMDQGSASFQIVDFQILVNIYCANAIYIPVLSGIALLKERYIKAAALAEALSHVAHIDGLTNVYNRRHLDLTLRQAIEQTQRYGRSLAVLLLDVDCFKHINDAFGHDVGDQILIGITSVIRQELRTTDTFGRWGGEEFLVVAPETDLEQAQQLAERLREIIAQWVHERVGSVTASFGVSTYRLGDTVEAMVKRADDALYQAKLNGRNRVEVQFDSTIKI
jgi:diguanylate cyclase (GGDEF)-like protein